VVDVAKGDVDALAREGKSIHERRRWSLREEEISRKKINAAEQGEHSRLPSLR
jgi:tuftelin-interacting protein 11